MDTEAREVKCRFICFRVFVCFLLSDFENLLLFNGCMIIRLFYFLADLLAEAGVVFFMATGVVFD